MFRFFFMLALGVILASNFGTSQEKSANQVTFLVTSCLYFLLFMINKILKATGSVT